MKVSIIIPVFNEENTLPGTVHSLQRFRRIGHEVVIVDGGSIDATLTIAKNALSQGSIDRLIESEPGRALQMNSGARSADGDVYLFLHADTVLPENALALVASIPQSRQFWGRFDIRLSGGRIIFRVIESLVNLRSRLTSIATGDQAMFIEAELFRRVDGFPEIALMEDVAISRQLRQQQKPVCLKAKVITSSRRWETRGVFATIFLMWKLRLYYFLGVSPQKLNQLYR